MKTRERAVIYSLLAVLVMLNGVFLLSSSGRVALAEAAAWLQDLGPAASVTLTDEQNRELVLRNKAQRLSWGEGQFRQTYSVAFVEIGRALNPLMEQQTFVEERERLRAELEPIEEDYQRRLDAYGEQLRNADQRSPEAQQKLFEAQRLYEEYMQWGQQAMQRQNELAAQHFERAYRELVSAVDVVSERMGIDIVLRFIPTEKEFQGQDAESALNEIRLRSALRYPAGLDITEEVLEELAIQDRR